MDRDFVEKVREAVDITQLMAERGIKLVRSGRRLKALCPFHKEKTPSFYVEPDLGLYHCFGCGASGDAIKFVMETEAMSFPEALDYLAERFGVPRPAVARPQEKPGSASALEFAVKFYHEKLLSPEGAMAFEYLKSRGISVDSVNGFALGYAPAGNALLRAAHEEGLGIDDLAAAGLVHRNQDGNWFDFFRNRIVFPVYSPSGRNILGFSGRALGDEEPKYLNTPETSYFKKGELLYGLWRARQEIRKAERAILVEGNLDVVLSHQAGFTNAVAPLGTALTPSQARLLRKYSDRITIAFDGDNAGSAAARRAIPHFVQEGMMVTLSRLPDGEDPASLVTRGRAEELRGFLDSGEDWIAFLRGLYPDSLEGKKGFEAELTGILLPLQPEEREAYLSRAKEILGYSQDWVVGVNRRLSEGRNPVENIRKPERAKVNREIILLSHAITHQDNEPFAQGVHMIDPADLSNPVARRLLELWREGRSLSELLREEGLGESISAALTENTATEDDIKMSFVIMVMEARYRGLGRVIAKAEAAGDRTAADAALAQKPFLLRMVDILKKIKERKALRYPERRNLILEKLWSAWEVVNTGGDAKLAESELDRLDRLLSRINEPVWDDDQTHGNKGAKTHGRDKR